MMVELRCQGYGIGLRLPATPNEVSKTLSALREGLEPSTPVQISGVFGPVPNLHKGLEHIDLDSESDIQRLNLLADRVDRMSIEEQRTFAEALEAENAGNPEDALCIADNLDSTNKQESEHGMTAGNEFGKDAFWRLIAEAKQRCGYDLDATYQWLRGQLTTMGPQAAQNFHDIVHGYEELSNKYGLWTAAGLLCDGCSDDGFIDFQAWLIAQGKETFLAALADPDSLAAVEPYDGCSFEGLTYLGDVVCEKLTGQSAYDATDPDAYQRMLAELREDVVYDAGIGYPCDWGEAAEYLPRLCAKYLEPGELEYRIWASETMWNTDLPEIQKARMSGPPKREPEQNNMEGISL